MWSFNTSRTLRCMCTALEVASVYSLCCRCPSLAGTFNYLKIFLPCMVLGLNMLHQCIGQNIEIAIILCIELDTFQYEIREYSGTCIMLTLGGWQEVS